MQIQQTQKATLLTSGVLHMKEIFQNIYDLLEKIKQRPFMFLKEKTLWEIHNYVWGYELCLRVHNIDEKYEYKKFITNEFAEWLNRKTKWSIVQGWPGAINENTRNQEEAFDTFFKLIDEYKKEKP